MPLGVGTNLSLFERGEMSLFVTLRLDKLTTLGLTSFPLSLSLTGVAELVLSKS